MITDLANLGRSLQGTTDLGGAKAKDGLKNATAQTGKPDKAGSFDQILTKKVSDKPTEVAKKSDKDAKAYSLKKDPMPVQRNMDDMQPEKPEMDRASVSPSKNEPRTAQKESRSWEEPGSVKEKSASEKPGKKPESSSPDREQVMLKFMDSMESEFGIPPERIVEAMTGISESDQLSSPEDSASQVIAQLDLPKDQEQRALALYVGMLAQLQQAQQPQMKPEMAAAAATAATAPVLMTHQQRKTMLNNSLDQMNQKFFMQQQPAVMKPQMTAENMAQMTPETTDMSSQDLQTDSLQDGAFAKDQVSLGQQMQAGEKLPSFAKNADVMKPQQPMQPQKGYGASVQALQEKLQNSNIDPNSAEGKHLAKALAALSASAAALDQGLKNDPQNLQALKAEQALNVANSEATAAAAGIAAMNMSGDESDDMDDMGGDSSSSNPQFATAQPNAHLSQHQRAEGPGSANQSFGAMMAGGAGARQVGESEKQANMQQIMNQAQYMIKKGGGEAKIQMAPEGIGQVHMKVTVLDGKVNLEMSAETKEAKKLLESSMNELKSSLGQHHLSMDRVKVDVGNQLSSDSNRNEQQNQQRQMDMRQDQSKDQAREFWSQFNDGGGFDRRGTFFDNPGIRAYGGSSRQVQALTPDSPGAIAEKRYAGSGKGRGLNLVA